MGCSVTPLHVSSQVQISQSLVCFQPKYSTLYTEWAAEWPADSRGLSFRLDTLHFDTCCGSSAGKSAFELRNSSRTNSIDCRRSIHLPKLFGLDGPADV